MCDLVELRAVNISVIDPTSNNNSLYFTPYVRIKLNIMGLSGNYSV